MTPTEAERTRNNEGVRAATIYVARETEKLIERVKKEGARKVLGEVERQFNISSTSSRRLFNTCGIAIKRPAGAGESKYSVLLEMLASLEARVSKVEQRLI